MLAKIPVLTVVPLLALAACGFDGRVDDAQLLVPEDIELHWDRSFNGAEDGRVALVPVDMMIYDGASGEPVADHPIDIQIISGDAAIVGPEDVLPADPELDSEDLPIWDAWRDRYVVLVSEDRASSARVTTDATGLARVHLFVDRFAEVEGRGFAPIPVVVSMGVTDDTFLLVPR